MSRTFGEPVHGISEEPELVVTLELAMSSLSVSCIVYQKFETPVPLTLLLTIICKNIKWIKSFVNQHVTVILTRSSETQSYLTAVVFAIPPCHRLVIYIFVYYLYSSKI